MLLIKAFTCTEEALFIPQMKDSAWNVYILICPLSLKLTEGWLCPFWSSFLIAWSDFFFFANVLIPISDTHKYSPTTSNDSKRQKEKHLRLFFFTFCGLWYKNSNNSLWSTDFNDPASGVCFVAWEEWEGSKAAGCPFWLPKTTINTYWEGQDCSHLPVNIMTVWKSSRSCEI